MTGRWTRRDLAAALVPGLVAACAPVAQPLVSVNLLDTPSPTPAPEPDAGALLESAFDEARRMTVPVRLNSSGPFQFVVDTGANRSVVAREVAQACALPSGGQAPVHGIAGVQAADLAMVRRYTVGGDASDRLLLPLLPRVQLGADGLMGVDVLKNRRVVLDFVSNRFEVSPSGGGIELGRELATRIPPSELAVRVPAQNRFGQLVIVDAEVGGVRVNAFIDSGSQVTVGNRSLRDAVIRARPEFGVRLAPVPLISATGQTARGEFALLPTVRLRPGGEPGDWHLRGPACLRPLEAQRPAGDPDRHRRAAPLQRRHARLRPQAGDLPAASPGPPPPLRDAGRRQHQGALVAQARLGHLVEQALRARVAEHPRRGR